MVIKTRLFLRYTSLYSPSLWLYVFLLCHFLVSFYAWLRPSLSLCFSLYVCMFVLRPSLFLSLSLYLTLTSFSASACVWFCVFLPQSVSFSEFLSMYLSIYLRLAMHMLFPVPLSKADGQRQWHGIESRQVQIRTETKAGTETSTCAWKDKDKDRNRNRNGQEQELKQELKQEHTEQEQTGTEWWPRSVCRTSSPTRIKPCHGKCRHVRTKHLKTPTEKHISGCGGVMEMVVAGWQH